MVDGGFPLQGSAFTVCSLHMRQEQQGGSREYSKRTRNNAELAAIALFFNELKVRKKLCLPPELSLLQILVYQVRVGKPCRCFRVKLNVRKNIDPCTPFFQVQKKQRLVLDSRLRYHHSSFILTMFNPAIIEIQRSCWAQSFTEFFLLCNLSNLECESVAGYYHLLALAEDPGPLLRRVH